MDKHKVFVSFSSTDIQYKNLLVQRANQYNIFDDYSVNTGDISDLLNDESIRKKIRDEYLRESTVTLILVGRDIKRRKFVDWEIQASMIDTQLNKRSGIIVINLPTVSQNRRAISQREKELVAPHSVNWFPDGNRQEIEDSFKYTPSRVLDNINAGAEICFVDWGTVYNNPTVLKELIDISYKRRRTVNYDTSARLRRRNG